MTTLKKTGFSAFSRMIAVFALMLAVTAGWAGSAQAEDLAGGTWAVQEYKISGTWRIYTEGDKTYIELSDDFRTRRAPDLKLFFSPLAADQVRNKNATDGSLLIAELDKARGGQRYEIPAGTDFSAYQSLVLHCEKFSKLWGATPLAIENTM